MARSPLRTDRPIRFQAANPATRVASGSWMPMSMALLKLYRWNLPCRSRWARHRAEVVRASTPSASASSSPSRSAVPIVIAPGVVERTDGRCAP